jgi:DNA-binding MarR family transcriptional regulator
MTAEELIEATLQAQREVARAVHREADPAWLQLDLTMGQLKALFALADDALTVGGLGNILGMGRPAASLLVDRLFQLDLISREEDPRDRRRTRVQLTARGQEVVLQLRQGGQERMRTWLGHLNEPDLAALLQGLRALARAAALDGAAVALHA